MKTELIFILVSGALAALVGLGALVAVLRGWGERTSIPDSSPAGTSADPPSGAPVTTPSHDAVVRVVWWVAIAGVLVGIGISNTFPTHRAAIYALGGAAVVTSAVMLLTGGESSDRAGFDVAPLWLQGGAGAVVSGRF